jgi:hypothetical protein
MKTQKEIIIQMSSTTPVTVETKVVKVHLHVIKKLEIIVTIEGSKSKTMKLYLITEMKNYFESLL